MFAACAAPKPARGPDHRTAPIVVNVDPGLVEMTAEATTTLLAADTRNELGIRVRIVGKALPDAKRPALNLGLVLDTSGSMEGDAIVALRDSAKALVAKLRDGDRISIVAFHSRAEVLVPNLVVDGAGRVKLAKAIDGITARGTTDLAAGLATGLGQVMQAQLPTGINRIVLLSDGVPNNTTQLAAAIAGIHQRGISVTSLGLGLDYDTTLMTQIARDTGGSFHYLEKPTEVAAVFDHELTKMTTVVGRNLHLTLEPGPNVTIQALPGLSPMGDGKFVAVVGDLAAGEVRDLMIPISVTARGEGSTAELVQANLTFQDVIGNSGQQQREGFVAVKTSKDAAAVAGAVKIGLEVARVRAAAAGATLEAIGLARQGQVEPARQHLATAITAVRAAAKKHTELDPLIRELEELSADLAKIVPAQIPVVKRSAADHAPAPAMAPAAVEPRLRHAEEKAYKGVRGER